MTEQEFATQVETHRAKLVNIVRKTYRLSFADAEDRVQDALLKCWKHRDQIDDYRAIQWFIAAVSHQSMNYIRDCQWQSSTMKRYRREVPRTTTPEQEAEPLPPSAEDQLRDVLPQLRPAVRQALNEVHMNGRKWKDVAAEFGFEDSDFRSAVGKALVALREELAD